MERETLGIQCIQHRTLKGVVVQLVNELTIKPQDQKKKKRLSAVLELWSHDSLNKMPEGESFTSVLSAIGLTRKMF